MRIGTAEVAITGVILAGGDGRRFGGRDKAWLRLDGRPLLCHAWQRLRPQVDTLLVSSQRHGWAYQRLGIETLPEYPPRRGLGPMAAIAGALNHAPDRYLALMPVDAPLAPPDYVARLAARLDAATPAAAVHDGQRRQPLFAVLPGTLAAAARDAAARDPMPSVQAWFDEIGVAWTDVGAGPDAFTNINHPDDLERVARASRSSSHGR